MVRFCRSGRFESDYTRCIFDTHKFFSIAVGTAPKLKGLLSKISMIFRRKL